MTIHTPERPTLALTMVTSMDRTTEALWQQLHSNPVDIALIGVSLVCDDGGHYDTNTEFIGFNEDTKYITIRYDGWLYSIPYECCLSFN